MKHSNRKTCCTQVKQMKKKKYNKKGKRQRNRKGYFYTLQTGKRKAPKYTNPANLGMRSNKKQISTDKKKYMKSLALKSVESRQRKKRLQQYLANLSEISDEEK